MGLHDNSVFLGGPLFLANGGAQLIVPTFAALLANPSLQVRRNERPVVGTVPDDVSTQKGNQTAHRKSMANDGLR